MRYWARECLFVSAILMLLGEEHKEGPLLLLVCASGITFTNTRMYLAGHRGKQQKASAAAHDPDDDVRASTDIALDRRASTDIALHPR